MKKVLAGVVLAGVLAFSSVPAYATEGTASPKTAQEFDLTAFTEFVGDVNLDSLHLDDFDVKKVDIDALVKGVKDSKFLQDLDLSQQNFDAVIALTEDQELMKSFGITSVDPKGLEAALKDERVVSLTKKLMTDAADGKSIDAQARALARNPEVQKLFREAAGGVELTTVLSGLNTENVTAGLNRIAEALSSEKTAETSEAAASLEALARTAVDALKK